jgi:hypothetical protein
VDTSLILNGNCVAQAAPGIFSGDSCYLQIFTDLALLEWWDQTDGQPAQPPAQSTQFKYAAQLNCHGGGLGSPADTKYEVFFNAPFDLSYTLFTVPGHSVAVYVADVNVSYNIIDGRDINDRIAVDFASPGANARIVCPSVNLQILTGPPTTR